MEKFAEPFYGNVMIVDDNNIDRYVVELILKRNNFARNVINIESGNDALNYISENINHPENLPELILLDINMPNMNGFEFLDKYKLLPEGIKGNCSIMMLTTSIHPSDIEQANSSQYVSKFINKPLKLEKLVEIHKTLSQNFKKHQS